MNIMKTVSLAFVTAVALSSVAPSQAELLPGDARRGAEIYAQRCVMCHGENGDGNGGMAANFLEEWYRFTKTDEELAESIRNGFRSEGKSYAAGSMPPQLMNNRDLEDVIAYLRSRFGEGRSLSLPE